MLVSGSTHAKDHELFQHQRNSKRPGSKARIQAAVDYNGSLRTHLAAKMPNIAEVLKSEIARIARKEIRADAESLKKSQSTQRSEIAALKRRLHELEQQFKKAAKTPPKAVMAEGSGSDQKLRFSAKGLKSRRALLGLSAADCGLLLGTSGQSIYAWEEGKARPRAKYLPKIAALRTIGKKQIAIALESLRASSK